MVDAVSFLLFSSNIFFPSQSLTRRVPDTTALRVAPLPGLAHSPCPASFLPPCVGRFRRHSHGG
jgi:hypothetical protein